jgi:hypothetical protein
MNVELEDSLKGMSSSNAKVKNVCIFITSHGLVLNGYYTHRQVNITKSQFLPHLVFMCSVRILQQKASLFQYIALAGWSL